MKLSLLENFVSLLKCPNLCDDNVYLMFDSTKKYGLSIGLKICCNSCNWKTEFFSSATLYKKNFIEQQEPRKSKCVDKNHLILTHVSLWLFVKWVKWLSSLEKFCGIMNMKPPMNKKSYNKTLSNLLDVYKNLVDQNMKNADELIPAGETSRDICSFDGSWQKRGFISNNGVVSAISVESGKCIDFQIETKTCKLCSIWKLKICAYPVITLPKV